MNHLNPLRRLASAARLHASGRIFAGIVPLIIVSISPVIAQQSSSPQLDGASIQGVVLNVDGTPADNAEVHLHRKDVAGSFETRTNTAGSFTFAALPQGSYLLNAEKPGSRSPITAISLSSADHPAKISLTLQNRQAPNPPHAPTSTSSAPMEFADKPNFTVAGVTDWTAVGGHGSDSSLRTSEALTRETLTLKPDGKSAAGPTDANESEASLGAALAAAPGNFDANHRLGDFYLHQGRFQESVPLLERASQIDSGNDRNQYDLALACQGVGDYKHAHAIVTEMLVHQDDADLHRLAGELDEKLGDPLAAVREYEQAARRDPSEQNYFEWGSELLLHRAVWQALEVFRKGAEAYPQSGRMLTALGAALFAGARYDAAALRLCEASDLNPADPKPYIFMGKIEIAAPNPLPCIQAKLGRFVQQQPTSASANYLYAMAVLKNHQESASPQATQQAEALLQKAVALDSKCADAYLQLGILSSSRGDFGKAIGFYNQAIAADPQLSESYYRLGVAYDRTGDQAKAREEFQLHDAIEKKEAEVIENQRKEIKQFLVVQSEPVHPAAH